MKGIYKKAWESYLRPFHVQGLRNAHHRERTTQKAHADMYNTRNLPLFSQKEARMYINLKSASNLNGNLNCSKELEHYAS